MYNVRDTKSAAQPASVPSIRLHRTDLKTDMPFDFDAILPLSEPTEAIPAWSPSLPEEPLPKPLNMLFPRTYFDCVRAKPPSPTMMRHFNEK
jgi:hypothetical protein